MKALLIVGFLGLSGLFTGCSTMATMKGPSCPYCQEKVTRVYNTKGIPIDWRTDYACSVCGTNCNQSCPAKCAECAAAGLACCKR